MPRLQQILCAVDESEPSAQAMRQAMAFARWSGARLTVLHVAAPVYIPMPELVLPLTVNRLANESDQAIGEWMQEQFGTMAEAAGVPACLVVKSGAPAREIATYAAGLPADLLVVGTHGTGGFERLVLGSVAEKVLRTAPCPVLTVPPHGVATSRLPFERVLCAIDFSECSLVALEYAMTAALDSGASLTLAHVIEWPWSEPPAPAFSELPAAEASALADFRRRREQDTSAPLGALVPETLAHRCHTRISHGRSHVQILKLATEERADLIVLGVHGRKPIDMAMFGSTTHHVVRHATCPVLTVRH